MDNAMIEFPVYFTSHMRIARQIMNIIPEWFHVFMIFMYDRGA